MTKEQALEERTKAFNGPPVITYELSQPVWIEGYETTGMVVGMEFEGWWVAINSQILVLNEDKIRPATSFYPPIQ